jgi:hypothetical protein
MDEISNRIKIKKIRLEKFNHYSVVLKHHVHVLNHDYYV